MLVVKGFELLDLSQKGLVLLLPCKFKLFLEALDFKFGLKKFLL